MAKNVSAADMVANYKSGMGGAGAKWAKGIGRVTENPAQKALARVQDGTWARNTVAAQDRMAAGLSATTLESWKAGANAAQSQYTGAATKAALKYERKAAALAAAATAASQAAAGVTGAQAKWLAATNAMRQAFGKPAL